MQRRLDAISCYCRQLTIVFAFSGHIDHASLYKNLQLVIRQYLLPYDDRKPRAWFETFVRNFAWLQNGRPLDLLHFANAH